MSEATKPYSILPSKPLQITEPLLTEHNRSYALPMPDELSLTSLLMEN